MIQSRKNLIEDAFYKARGSATKVILIQQKESLSNTKKNKEKAEQVVKKKVITIDKELNNNKFKAKKIEQINNLDTNSIDKKAQQFADFFNGEIVDLE